MFVLMNLVNVHCKWLQCSSGWTLWSTLHHDHVSMLHFTPKTTTLLVSNVVANGKKDYKKMAIAGHLTCSGRRKYFYIGVWQPKWGSQSSQGRAARLRVGRKKNGIGHREQKRPSGQLVRYWEVAHFPQHQERHPRYESTSDMDTSNHVCDTNENDIGRQAGSWRWWPKVPECHHTRTANITGGTCIRQRQSMGWRRRRTKIVLRKVRRDVHSNYVNVHHDVHWHFWNARYNERLHILYFFFQVCCLLHGRGS